VYNRRLLFITKRLFKFTVTDVIHSQGTVNTHSSFCKYNGANHSSSWNAVPFCYPRQGAAVRYLLSASCNFSHIEEANEWFMNQCFYGHYIKHFSRFRTHTHTHTHIRTGAGIMRLSSVTTTDLLLRIRQSGMRTHLRECDNKHKKIVNGSGVYKR
jgi:hypothetical protein